MVKARWPALPPLHFCPHLGCLSLEEVPHQYHSDSMVLFHSLLCTVTVLRRAMLGGFLAIITPQALTSCDWTCNPSISYLSYYNHPGRMGQGILSCVADEGRKLRFAGNSSVPGMTPFVSELRFRARSFEDRGRTVLGSDKVGVPDPPLLLFKWMIPSKHPFISIGTSKRSQRKGTAQDHGCAAEWNWRC